MESLAAEQHIDRKSCPKETATRSKLLRRGGSVAGLDENAGAQQFTVLQTSKACAFRMAKIALEIKQILVGHVQQIVGRTSVHWPDSCLPAIKRLSKLAGDR